VELTVAGIGTLRNSIGPPSYDSANRRSEDAPERT
jgi:hypothetical protein